MKKIIAIGCLAFLILNMGIAFAQQTKAKKILVIGVDGMIYTAIDYANTPGMDKLINDGSYSMNGYGGLPSNSATGWSTLLTGVTADKHGVKQEASFAGNNFSQYPSLVKRVKQGNPAIKVASIVRQSEINKILNLDADIKSEFGSDAQVFDKTKELLKGNEADMVFAEFSSPKEVGMSMGYQLRQAAYVLAVQQTDSYVDQLIATIKARSNYANESWAVFLVSTHGGTESGQSTNNTMEEILVPIVFSGADIDKKQLVSDKMPARENANNFLQINKSAAGDRTYGRIPIAGTRLSGMDKFTMEMWIKAGENSSDPAIMGDKDWDSGSNPGFVICRSGASWKLNIASDKRTRYDIGSSMPIEDGKWHHIAISFDKTNECIIYQDGLRVGGQKLAYKVEDSMASPFNFLALAQEGTGTYGGGAPNWAGSFNEVRIWTRPLDLETIKKYMFAQNIEHSDHPALQDLNLYLKMDEHTGTKLTDYSGKGNHGVLIGTATERHPYFSTGLTDVAVNILNHMGMRVDGSWGLEGYTLRSNVPFRLFKVK